MRRSRDGCGGSGTPKPVHESNARLRRVQTTGNLGDVQSVGNGIAEMRFHFGSGYRVYFIHEGAQVVVLLCGGDKDSQARDIRRAEQIATEMEESEE